MRCIPQNMPTGKPIIVPIITLFHKYSLKFHGMIKAKGAMKNPKNRPTTLAPTIKPTTPIVDSNIAIKNSFFI
jgi:hypothetical protein